MAGERPLFDPDRMKGVPAGPAVPRTMTVSQLNNLIKQLLEDQLPGTFHLIGEISNLSKPTSGHFYLTLKDDRGELRCAMWKSVVKRLKFEPSDGQQVIATGHVEVYLPRGYYQFIISKLEPRGTGSLELAFRQLRERLEKEGLFDPRHKKPIPRYPRRIAVVTSPTGAAIHDILQTIQRRYPCVEVLVHPVRVQGEGAANEIAAAIARLNGGACGAIDVMIVGRGGGSLEDLWAFNEEKVARAIFASRIPVISAVGHEVDVTIADLVADLRAPTPTAAGELAVPLRTELIDQQRKLGDRLRRSTRHILDLHRSKLNALLRQRCLQDPLAPLRSAEQQMDELTARLRLAVVNVIARRRSGLQNTVVRLAGLQPSHRIQLARQRLADLVRHLKRTAQTRSQEHHRELLQLRHQLQRALPVGRLPLTRERLDRLRRELNRAAIRGLESRTQRLEALTGRLEASSFHKTLARGFTITRRDDGRIITAAAQIQAGDQIVTQTASGQFKSRVSDAGIEPPSSEADR